ncbi:response regulator transcription factor [Ferrimonas pelagia]|uniref:Cationic peptide response regulator transcription factor CprR n=1 Tax=Ferrimonas pelagia TaxID=1177826 RepID=A0ABP9FC77_9GAMM
MIRVLVIEDEQDLAENLLDYLELEGMLPDHASNGLAGLQLARSNRYDVMVLDLGLPKLDGISLCQALRQDGSDMPVLMLTARDSLDDKLAGFAAGSDDYLVKPFEMAELVARIRVLAARRSGQSRRLTQADLVLDLDSQQASRGGALVKLSPAQFTLLETLLRAAPSPVSRSELEHALWGEDTPPSNALKVHLHHLRKALADAAASGAPELIETVSGVGWRLVSVTQPEEAQ